MATNMDRAALVARHVQLQTVNLRKALLNSALDPLDPPDFREIQVTQGHRGRYKLPEKHPDFVYVYVDLRFTASHEDVERVQSELVDLTATYQLAYTLESAAEYPEDALQYFAELNGVYNIWPYWRELVQTVTGRVGLSAIVVPVYRPAVRELEEAPAEPPEGTTAKKKVAKKRTAGPIPKRSKAE
ncbi:MAG TPA: hypothetical protein VFQ76_04830 [Longimicrobiaceae bacterium]|nr:hypothetical protein [Longimicrobiaceae bacterium]